MILADTAFGSVEFLHGVRKLKYHGITGVAISRKLVDGRALRHLHKLSTTSSFAWLEISCYRLLVLSQTRQWQARKTLCFIYQTPQS